MKKLVPYALVLAAAYCLLPLPVRNTGAAIWMMLAALPLVSLLCGFCYGKRENMGVVLPLLAMAVYLPSVWLHYNSSAWVFSPVHGILVALGALAGSFFYRQK